MDEEGHEEVGDVFVCELQMISDDLRLLDLPGLVKSPETENVTLVDVLVLHEDQISVLVKGSKL